MTSVKFEAFLALIYTDAKARAEFLANPLETAKNAGLTAAECQALSAIDRAGLEMAATSFQRKRGRAIRIS
jgi:hypothetical protein